MSFPIPAFLRLLLFPLALAGFEAVAEKGAAFSGWGWPEWKVFLVGGLWSGLFWVSLIFWGGFWVWQGGHRRWVARLYAAFFSAWLLFAYFATYKYLKDMYHVPNVHIMEFTINEWRNAWALAKDALHGWHLISILAVLVALSFWLGSELLRISPWMHGLGFWKRTSLLSLLGVAFLSASMLALGWHRYQDPLPWDANWHRMFFQYGLMLSGNKTNLQVAHRPALPDRPKNRRHNVLIILNESLRADVVFPEVKLSNGFSDTVSPHVLARARDEMGRVFPIAYCNSGATNVSVPSLATGLPPESGTYEFHRAPTFWNIAKSLDYRTFLFSPQDWRWEHFDEFFLDRSVDHAIHRRHFPNSPLANDLGVDDVLVVDSLLHWLSQQPRDKPFFGVIQFNITHPPFYGGAASLALPFYSHERYRPSAALLDEYTERLFRGLERLGLYDSLLILYTADHGENIRSRNLARLGAFYEDTHRIPFFIKLPRDSGWSERHSAKLENMKTWQSKPVQNLDILPTLLDYWDLSEADPFRGRYAGRSLFGPGAETERILGGQNTGEIRAWIPEGCFVYKPPIKLVLANHSPPQLFDLSVDALEENNLWDVDSIRAENEPWLREWMRSAKGRTDLCRRLGKNCPESFLK